MMEFIREIDPLSGTVTLRVEHDKEIVAGFVGTEEQVQALEDFFNLGYRAGSVGLRVQFLVREDARAWGPLYLSRVLSLYIQPPTKAPAPQGAPVQGGVEALRLAAQRVSDAFYVDGTAEAMIPSMEVLGAALEAFQPQGAPHEGEGLDLETEVARDIHFYLPEDGMHWEDSSREHRRRCREAAKAIIIRLREGRAS